MIKQKATIKKQTSDSGRFNFPEAAIGTEIWINPRSITMARYSVKETKEMFMEMVVKEATTEMWIPVSVLHFTDEFEVT